MARTWILVGNASQAAIYLNDGPNKGLTRLKMLEHAASREKGTDLTTDRPGQQQGPNAGRGSLVGSKSPKEVEAERFALEVARELDQGRTKNAYERLILVASPHFMGLINQSLESHVRQLVTDSIEKDYTKISEKELAGHLEGCIFL